MYTRIGSNRNKPPQPPNPLASGRRSSAQRPHTYSCNDGFRAAMKQRKANHPFDRISAYKVRESRDNLRHERAVVASIAEYLRARPRDRHFSMLLGCTEDDKAQRLKGIPAGIAHELGYNLIPAIQALTVEGVPAADIGAFIKSIKPLVDNLLAECDAIQMGTSRSIQPEYDALKAGNSSTENICAEALRMAGLAVHFCEQHGVLRGCTS